MAINTNSRANRPVANLKYSAVLGCLYVANAFAEASIKEVKAIIGDDAWKQGFTGLAAGSTSVRARDLLEERGVVLATGGVSGKLISVQTRMVPVSGSGEQPYLNVGLDDGNEVCFFSVDLMTGGAQMLLRKLANLGYGDEITVNLFGKMGDIREGASRAYADHSASVKKGDDQVPALDITETLIPEKQAAEAEVKKLRNCSKELVRAQVNAVELAFFENLLNDVATRIKEQADAAKTARRQQEQAPA